MPQLTQLLLVYQSQWFWLLIVLAIIYFVLGKGMVPKIEKVVDDRNAKIENDLKAAEKARAEADEIEEKVRAAEADARDKAQAIMAKARESSAAESEAQLAKLDAELSAQLDQAEARIGKMRSEALANLEREAAEAASAIVAKVSGAQVSAAEAEPKVKAVMAHG